MEAGFMKKLLLKVKRDWWRNIAEMEAELIEKYSWNGSGIDEKYCWNGSGIDENILQKWKWDWWKILLKWRRNWWKTLLNENEIFLKINIIKFAPNCPGRIVASNCPCRIVRAKLSCAELSGHRKSTCSLRGKFFRISACMLNRWPL